VFGNHLIVISNFRLKKRRDKGSRPRNGGVTQG
jgi:hypothetical protein